MTADRPPVVLEPVAVSVPTAAKALGIGLTAAWDEVTSGRLRSFRYGTRVLVPTPALAEWVAAQEKAS